MVIKLEIAFLHEDKLESKTVAVIKNKKKGSEFMGGTRISKTCRIITLSFDKSESQQTKIRAQF
jgi:hypothetical protein